MALRRLQQEQATANDDDDEQEDYYNLDASVLALLSKLPDDATATQIHGRIALIKLQQATLVGHAKLAAQWLDSALHEAGRDKKAHFLLQRQMQDLQGRLRRIEANKTNARRLSGDDDDEGLTIVSSPAAASNTNDPPIQVEANDANCNSEGIQKLKNDLKTSQEQVDLLQECLYEQVSHEIESLKHEQEALHQQQERFHARWKASHKTLQRFAPSKRKEELADALAQVSKNNYSAANGPCVVCHDLPATLAVIPCGHLCLCDVCVETFDMVEEIQKQCPVCRGLLMSTVKIYKSIP